MEFNDQIYSKAIKIIGMTYKDQPGIMEIREDSFLGNEVMLFVDSKKELPVIPNKILGYQIRVIDPYVEVSQLDYIIEEFILNEPSLWDDNSSLKSFNDMRDFHIKIIKKYESK